MLKAIKTPSIIPNINKDIKVIFLAFRPSSLLIGFMSC